MDGEPHKEAARIWIVGKNKGKGEERVFDPRAARRGLILALGCAEEKTQLIERALVLFWCNCLHTMHQEGGLAKRADPEKGEERGGRQRAAFPPSLAAAHGAGAG
jgi:hypothetical protein